jgi:hypothetical protein
MRKTGLTIDEHKRVGQELHAARSQVLDCIMMFINNYTINSRQGQAARKVERAIDRLRCVLDDAACREHPAEFNPHWYYPGTTGSDKSAPAWRGTKP